MSSIPDFAHTELLALSLGLILAAGAGFTLAGPGTTGDGVSAHSEGLRWHNQITVKHNGETVARFHNLLTDQGQDYILEQLSGSDATTATQMDNASYIALGNGTAPAAGDTVLNEEIATGGLARTQGAVTTYGPGEFSVKHQFTATSDIGVVNTTALNWGSSGTTLISGGGFGTEATILDGDQLTVVHNITIS